MLTGPAASATVLDARHRLPERQTDRANHPRLPAPSKRCYFKAMSKFTLSDLEQRIIDRASAPAEQSYTRKLLDKGAPQCAKKFGEEAVEAVIAVAGEDRDRVIAESADVLYHLLVMIHARGVTLAEIESLLETRTKKSGLEEKASRGSG
jgi:phosphoribosyl-ATP pyrophosphohydrolase